MHSALVKVLLFLLIDVHLGLGCEELAYVELQDGHHLGVLFLPIDVVEHFGLAQHKLQAFAKSVLRFAAFENFK
jgi:hypothetical protein